MTAIVARYTLTFEEWAEGQNTWCKSRAAKAPGARWLAYLWIASGVLGGYSFAAPPHVFGAILLSIMALQHAIVKWRRTPLLRKAYDEAGDRERETLLEVNETGYASIRPEFNECRMAWRCFSGWREGELTIVLGRGAQYCCIPKRALTVEQAEGLRTLLRTHLP